jgi:hypothetical protein
MSVIDVRTIVMRPDRLGIGLLLSTHHATAHYNQSEQLVGIVLAIHLHVEGLANSSVFFCSPQGPKSLVDTLTATGMLPSTSAFANASFPGVVNRTMTPSAPYGKSFTGTGSWSSEGSSAFNSTESKSLLSVMSSQGRIGPRPTVFDPPIDNSATALYPNKALQLTSLTLLLTTLACGVHAFCAV